MEKLILDIIDKKLNIDKNQNICNNEKCLYSYFENSDKNTDVNLKLKVLIEYLNNEKNISDISKYLNKINIKKINKNILNNINNKEYKILFENYINKLYDKF